MKSIKMSHYKIGLFYYKKMLEGIEGCELAMIITKTHASPLPNTNPCIPFNSRRYSKSIGTGIIRFKIDLIKVVPFFFHDCTSIYNLKLNGLCLQYAYFKKELNAKVLNFKLAFSVSLQPYYFILLL